MYKHFFGTYKHKECDVKIFRCSADVGINRWGYEVVGHGFYIEEAEGNSQREAKGLAIRWAECFRSRSFQLLGNLFEFEQVTNAEKLAAMDYERCQDFLNNRVIETLFSHEHSDSKEQLIIDWERMYTKTSFIGKDLVEHVNDIRYADMKSQLKAEVDRNYRLQLELIDSFPNYPGLTIEWDEEEKGYRQVSKTSYSYDCFPTEEDVLLDYATFQLHCLRPFPIGK